MPACEKCWKDSSPARLFGEDPTYRELIESRNCAPEEQAGPDAGLCPKCERMTLHQACGVCMNGCAPTVEPKEEKDRG